jgi:hypothetical protein
MNLKTSRNKTARPPNLCNAGPVDDDFVRDFRVRPPTRARMTISPLHVSNGRYASFGSPNASPKPQNVSRGIDGTPAEEHPQDGSLPCAGGSIRL